MHESPAALRGAALATPDSPSRLIVCFSSIERPISSGGCDGLGSIAPLRFLDQPTFGQLFMPGGVPHVWQSALEIARHACEIGLRLLRLDSGHS